MDLFEKCFAFTRAEETIAAGLYPYFTPIEEVHGNIVKVRGKEMIMVGSNNYLGLMDHPDVKEAAKKAIDKYGVATCGSRFLSGTVDLHEKLEARLAQFMKKEAAQTVSTGFQTNQAIIASLVGKDDVVICDRMVHASIIDACRLAFGESMKFKHNDMKDLERLLQSTGDRGKLVVVDGVFSMEGDVANLAEIVPLVKKYKARLLVDDAHGIGVMGQHGRGTCEHFGVESEVDLVMGTFSKSFASLGGFIAGDEPIIHYIKHHARSVIFSASIPPASTAAALAALRVMQEEPERIQRLNDIGDKMRKEYRRMGFDIGTSVSPIIPILIGGDLRTILVWKAMFERGVFVNPVLMPAVPDGQQLLRTSYMATHTDEQLDRVLEIFYEVGKEAMLIS